MNGSGFTIIQGSFTTNGPQAVRCAWLTNGAVLSGFTLRGGATLVPKNPATGDMDGGGVYGYSTNATVTNCLLINNTTGGRGGGAMQVTLLNSTLAGNSAAWGGGAAYCQAKGCLLMSNTANSGGGTYKSLLINCAVSSNSGGQPGTGVEGGTLINCTVSGNRHFYMSYITLGGGVSDAALTNCIVYGNDYGGDTNYINCTFNYCCSTPLPAGTANIALDPQLLADQVHLSPTSPCRGAGLWSAVSGMDIDGQQWSNNPAMGCDEWAAAPVVGGLLTPFLSGFPVTLKISGACPAGQDPITLFWLKDGGFLRGRPALRFGAQSQCGGKAVPTRRRRYLQLVASNSFGMATSAVAMVVVHLADAGGTSPAAPYTNWAAAATNLQDAVDVAVKGEFVLATNGVYATGGRVASGNLTNRVTIDHPVSVLSVNGPFVTFIQGLWDPATNGPGAVRCAWLTDGALLAGFTLKNGATRNDSSYSSYGGGVYCTSSNASLVNCVLTNNAAVWGGGGSKGTLRGCLVVSNLATWYGGGVYDSALINCTVTGNLARGTGGAGAYNDKLSGAAIVNSIVRYNYDSWSPGQYDDSDGFPNFTYYYSCSSMPTGTSNITSSPQLLDGIHLTSTSPCVGTGNAAYASGTDIDGEPWANPPSMGCDEYWEAGLNGPLSVGLRSNPDGEAAQRAYVLLVGDVTGRVTRTAWTFSDGDVYHESQHHLHQSRVDESRGRLRHVYSL